MKQVFFCLGILLLLSGGCMFAPHRETMYYDLALAEVPEKLNDAPSINVLEFDNNSGGSQKMLARLDQYRILEDPFNKWVQSPGELLSRHLGRQFNTFGDQPGYLVTGVVEVFEVNLDRQEFVLGGKYQIIRNTSPGGHFLRSFMISEKYEEAVPAAFAAAASRCAAALARQVNEDIVQNRWQEPADAVPR